MLFSTGYKVLQSQEKAGFAKCVRVQQNGKDKLMYDISGLQSLDMLLPTMQADAFLFVVVNLLDSIRSIRNIGFLQPTNIETTLDKLFVNPSTHQTKLIYLPVVDTLAAYLNPHYEFNLKFYLHWAIQTYPQLQTAAVLPLFSALSDPSSTLDQIRSLFGGGGGGGTADLASVSQAASSGSISAEQEETASEPALQPAPKKGVLSGLFNNKGRKNEKDQNFRPELEGGDTEILNDVFIPSLVLVGVKTVEKVELLIDKPSYTIGKSADSVDGRISFSNAVSRAHCRIVFAEGQSSLLDLGSANGTFLNGKKLEPNTPSAVKPGDKIKLANLNFVVQSI